MRVEEAAKKRAAKAEERAARAAVKAAKVQEIAHRKAAQDNATQELASLKGLEVLILASLC